MKLIVGLGNPGKEYVKTRHNIGFIVLDSFLGEVKWKKNNNYCFYETNYLNNKVIFMKPTTYMNLSGKAVAEVISYYKIELKDVLIIHDDLYLQEFNYKLKYDSSSGGHNGINSIIKELNSSAFCRLKIGIGQNEWVPISDYVLGKLSQDVINYLENDKFKNIIDCFIKNGIEKAMNDFNSNEE